MNDVSKHTVNDVYLNLKYSKNNAHAVGKLTLPESDFPWPSGKKKLDR